MSRKRARDWTRGVSDSESYLSVPQNLFDELNREFHFTVDACSSDENYKVDRHWTLEHDGLKQCWDNHTVWCHPFFDRNILLWIEKALAAVNCVSVFLLPASTDTRWFALVWDHVKHQARPGCEVRFLPKRLHYGGAKHAAAFASCIVVIKC